ncbi:MAG: hypothetical protein ACOC5T_05590 [Elusimicrobiota bacterium]
MSMIITIVDEKQYILNKNGVEEKDNSYFSLKGIHNTPTFILFFTAFYLWLPVVIIFVINNILLSFDKEQLQKIRDQKIRDQEKKENND